MSKEDRRLVKELLSISVQFDGESTQRTIILYTYKGVLNVVLKHKTKLKPSDRAWLRRQNFSCTSQWKK